MPGPAPKITVLTVSRRVDFLSRCVDSVRRQGYAGPVRHLLVIDDNAAVSRELASLGVPGEDVIHVPRRRLAATLPGVHEIDDLDSPRAADLVRAVSGTRLADTVVRRARSSYGAARQRAAVIAALGGSGRVGAGAGGRGR